MDFECTAWGIPSYSVLGWQRPCYLMADGYAARYQELVETTDWDSYGRGQDARCANCMAHCGYEPTAVIATTESLRQSLRAAACPLSRVTALEPPRPSRRPARPGRGRAGPARGRLPRGARPPSGTPITSVAATGGHLGSNLGVVELTFALHRVFDTPKDAIVWDTGHQAYVHKIVTGRSKDFARLRQAGGPVGISDRGPSRSTT